MPASRAFLPLAERGVYQLGKMSLNRMAQKPLFHQAEKTAAVAAEKKIAQNAVGGVSKQGTKLDLDALSRAGQVMDRGGLTRAGRALDKHGGRPGSFFPKARGSQTTKNAQGQFHLDDILTDHVPEF